MRAMRLTLLFVAPFLATGCAPLYEEVPAFGQSDPNQVAAVEQRPQPQQQYAIQSQEAVDPGQPVNIVGDANDGQQQDQEYADTDPSALTEFKSTLDPYGTWQDDGQYGTVWQPDPGVVGGDFAPYVTAGHWNYDNDYTWVSDYDWGWAPFHYGRWVFIAGRGWCWIPGRRYAGAWVTWRVGPAGYGYVGWGPMAPSWYWRNGSAYGLGWNVNTPYTFCHTSDLFSNNLHGRTLGGSEVVVVGNNTHTYTDGRTPAHPTVGPPLAHLGVMPPNVEHSPGVLRARAFAHPGSVSPNFPMANQAPRQVPYYTQPRGSIGNTYNPPIVTAPRYNGVVPQPYHYSPPIYRGPQQWGGAQQPRFNAPPQFGGGSRFGGGYGAPHSQMAPPPVYSHGGGSFGGGGSYGGGGGWHPPSSSFSSSSSSHSYTHSHGGGGGHGHR
jgi:hypothetical protein